MGAVFAGIGGAVGTVFGAGVGGVAGAGAGFAVGQKLGSKIEKLTLKKYGKIQFQGAVQRQDDSNDSQEG